jgi:hypothetical protein
MKVRGSNDANNKKAARTGEGVGGCFYSLATQIIQTDWSRKVLLLPLQPERGGCTHSWQKNV